MVMVPLLRKMSGALKSEDKTLPLLALHWSRICRAVQGMQIISFLLHFFGF